MNSRWPLAVQDILLAIEEIEEYTAGMDERAFLADQAAQRLAERCIEIISEASRHFPEDLKTHRPDIPWSDIAGIGNVIRHAYFSVNYARLWEIIQTDLPPLKAALESMLPAPPTPQGRGGA